MNPSGEFAKMLLIPMWQPHASAVALGLKKIETRAYKVPRDYRGYAAILACKKWDRQIKNIIGELPPLAHKAFADAGSPLWKMDLPIGKIIAAGVIAGCQSTWPIPSATANATRELLFLDYPTLDTPLERALGNYGQGRYGWVLSQVVQLIHPIPYTAHQGVYLLDRATTDAVLAESAAPLGL